MSAKHIWQSGIAGILVIAAVSGAALASEDDHRSDASNSTGEWIGIEAAIAVVTSAGYRDIEEIEREKGRYEVEARDADGREWEIYVDGRSGEIVKRERE